MTSYFKTFMICFVYITVVQSWSSPTRNSICSTWHGLFPHPTNCQLFYLCAHGHGCIMECSKGTYFHPTLKVCVWPGLADCSHAKGSSMTMLPVRRCSTSSSGSMPSNEVVVPHPRPPKPPPTAAANLPHPIPPSIPTTPHGPSVHRPISPAHGRPPVFPPASSTAPPHGRPPIHPTVLPPARPTPPPHERPPIHPPVLPPSPSPGQIVFPTNKPSVSPYPTPTASERPPIHPPIIPPHERPPIHPPILPPSPSTPPPHERPQIHPPILPPHPPHERPPIHPPILPPAPSTPAPHEWPPIHPPIFPPSPSTRPPHERPPIHPPILPPAPSTPPPHERPPIHPPILPPSPSTPPPHERPSIHPPVLPPSAGASGCNCCNECCKKCQNPDYKPRPDGNHHSKSNQTHLDMSSAYPIPSDLANAIIAISNDLISSKDKVNIHKLNGTMDKMISKSPSGQTPLLVIYRNPQDGHLELLADIINNIT